MIILLIPIDITSVKNNNNNIKCLLFIYLFKSSYSNCLASHMALSSSSSSSTSSSDGFGSEFVNSSISEDNSQKNFNCKKPIVFIPEIFSVIMWNLLYWVSFVMCWAIYPLMQNYSTAGDFTVLEKMKTSVRENAWFYIAMGVVGLVFLLIYIVLSHNINPIPVCMALANAWGLGLVILTLGYGIVAIPKKVWRKSSDAKALVRAYFEVSVAKRKLVKARDDLLKNLRLLKSYDVYIPKTDPFRKYIEIIIAEAPLSYYLDIVTSSTTDPLLEYDKLVSLHYNVMFYNHEYNLCNE